MRTHCYWSNDNFKIQQTSCVVMGKLDRTDEDFNEVCFYTKSPTYFKCICVYVNLQIDVYICCIRMYVYVYTTMLITFICMHFKVRL